MAEVPAVSNEISNEIVGTQTQAPTRTEQDDFAELLENEKHKTLTTPIPSVNLQSLFSVPLGNTAKFDVSASAAPSHTGSDQKLREISDMKRTQRSDQQAKTDKDNINKSAQVQDDRKVQQVKASEQAVQDMSKAIIGELELGPQFTDSIASATKASGSLSALDIDDLVSQINDKIKFLQDNGKIELSMNLKPEGLGSILMSVTSNRGIVSINLYADALTKRTLDDRLPELERALKSANLLVGDLKVLQDGRRRNNQRDNSSDLLYNA